MKNSAGFYTTSHNCKDAGGEAAAYVCIPQNLINLAGVHPSDFGEWHHASANRLAFFPKNEVQEARLDDLLAKIATLKASDLPKSKAAVWRGLIDNDAGFGGVEYKEGKYGKFVCSYGEPDGVLYYPSAEFAAAARKLLKI